jgi:hypothetical protein
MTQNKRDHVLIIRCSGEQKEFRGHLTYIGHELSMLSPDTPPDTPKIFALRVQNSFCTPDCRILIS